jgi:hypothetical protein
MSRKTLCDLCDAETKVIDTPRITFINQYGVTQKFDVCSPCIEKLDKYLVKILREAHKHG